MTAAVLQLTFTFGRTCFTLGRTCFTFGRTFQVYVHRYVRVDILILIACHTCAHPPIAGSQQGHIDSTRRGHATSIVSEILMVAKLRTAVLASQHVASVAVPWTLVN